MTIDQEESRIAISLAGRLASWDWRFPIYFANSMNAVIPHTERR